MWRMGVLVYESAGYMRKVHNQIFMRFAPLSNLQFVVSGSGQQLFTFSSRAGIVLGDM
jgi:hypothetical protein